MLHKHGFTAASQQQLRDIKSKNAIISSKVIIVVLFQFKCNTTPQLSMRAYLADCPCLIQLVIQEKIPVHYCLLFNTKYNWCSCSSIPGSWKPWKPPLEFAIQMTAHISEDLSFIILDQKLTFIGTLKVFKIFVKGSEFDMHACEK